MPTYTRLLALALLGSLAACGSRSDRTDVQSTSARSRSIFNPQPLSGEDRKSLAAVVRLNMGANGLCSASHLGDGVLLTAHHCIAPFLTDSDEDRPALRVASPPLKKFLGPIRQYEIHYPKAEGFIRLSGGRLGRQPDLAIIKVKGDDRAKAAALPKVEIGTETLGVGDELRIVGYGKDGFGSVRQVLFFRVFEPPRRGELNSGTVTVDSLDEIFYHLKWRNGDSTSAALPGDSGGPLLKAGPGGKLVAYAVVSTLGMGLEDETDLSSLSLRNTYVRLDREPVREWLEETLSDER